MHLFHRLTDVLPISQYLLKRYAEEVTENPDQVMGFLVRMLYAETYRVDLHEDDLIAVCTRIKVAAISTSAARIAASPADSQASCR